MKVKVITVATHEGLGLNQLKKSMDKHSIDYVVLCQGEPWRGFGMKITETVKYLKTLPHEYTHFIFIDAYDVAFLGNIDEILVRYKALGEGIIFSTEKACWPDAELSSQYPESVSDWKHLNSGCYIAPIGEFLSLMTRFPVQDIEDDQRFFTKLFLSNGGIKLDTHCVIFQSIAFEHTDDFKIENRVFRNWSIGSFPLIIHGNGRTPMDKIHQLI